MKINQQTHFIVLNQQADSLYSLIADGQLRTTTLGRNKWASLIGSGVSLQNLCQREGFNVVSDLAYHRKARIGILGNNEDRCDTCDTSIGFGTAGQIDGVFLWEQRQKGYGIYPGSVIFNSLTTLAFNFLHIFSETKNVLLFSFDCIIITLLVLTVFLSRNEAFA